MGVGAIVKGKDLFASLTPEEVHNVSRFSSVKKYERGDVVYRCGTPASHLFILLKGRVLLRLPGQGQESGLAFSKAEPGDFLGLAALAGSERYTVTATCVEPSEIQVIEGRPFRELLDANPHVGFNVMSAVAKSYCERSVGVLQRLQAIVSQLEFIPLSQGGRLACHLSQTSVLGDASDRVGGSGCVGVKAGSPIAA